MQIIKNRADFIKYCLRKLGDGVWEIELTTDQQNDCVDDAMAYYGERHPRGSNKEYIVIKVDEKQANDKFVELPENILYVARVLQSAGLRSLMTGGSGFGSFPITWGDIKGSARVPTSRAGTLNFGIQNYLIWNNYLNTINYALTPANHFRFDFSTRRLHMDFPVKKDDIISIECTKSLDENSLMFLYNENWMKEYTIALMKKQWGENMTKYDMQLSSSGVNINGQKKLDEADQDILRLREELDEKYVEQIHVIRG